MFNLNFIFSFHPSWLVKKAQILNFSQTLTYREQSCNRNIVELSEGSFPKHNSNILKRATEAENLLHIWKDEKYKGHNNSIITLTTLLITSGKVSAYFTNTMGKKLGTIKLFR